MSRSRFSLGRTFGWLGRLSLGRLAATALASSLYLAWPADGQAQFPVPTADLSVRVTDFETETLADHVKVELLKFPDGFLQLAFTDAAGQVHFLSLMPQQYILRVSKDGYQSADVPVDIRRGEHSKSVNIQIQRLPADSPAPPGGTISARMLAIPESARKEFQKGFRVLNEQKNPRQSVGYFQKAIGISPNYFEAHFMLGMAYLQLNSPSEAQAALQKSIKLNPKSLSPYYPLSVSLISQKRYNEAERLLLQALEMDKKGWQWPFELARCYAAEGKWDKALVYGQTAHDQPNPPSKVHLLMADLYSNTGNTEKALEELEKFAKLDPNSSLMPRVLQVISELRKRQ